MYRLVVIILISLLLLSSMLPSTLADHDKGKGKSKDKEHRKDKDKDGGVEESGSSGCREIIITNNTKLYGACIIVDTILPQFVDMFKTENYTCVNAMDNVGIKSVYVNGVELEHHTGSYTWYCTKTPVDLIDIVITDLAGNMFKQKL